MNQRPKRVLFSSEEQKRAINRSFAILFVLILLSSAGGLYALVKYFERTSVLEATGRLEKTTADIQSRLRRAIAAEARRPFAEYSYFNLRSAQLESFLKFSTISSLTPNSQVPGLTGFFQVRAGRLELPFFPQGMHLNLDRRDERMKLAQKVLRALTKTVPLSATEDDTKAFKLAFGGLTLPDLTVLPGEKSVKTVPLKKFALKDLTKSKSGKSFSKLDEESPADLEEEVKTLSDSAESFPMQAFPLESGYIVFYRSVFQNGVRYIQGFVADQKIFFTEIFRPVLSDRSLGRGGRLSVLIDDNVLDLFPAPAENSRIIYRSAMPAPLERIEVMYSVTGASLSAAQMSALALVAAVLLLFCAGLYLVYRASLRQNELLRDQANFVSAVSHELRTPLTAIRMHSELLNQDWIGSESEKSKSYSFILAEAERLSRLIENVLQFARLERGTNALNIEAVSAGAATALVRQKLDAVVKPSGFTLETDVKISKGSAFRADLDALSQIMINLADNAVKFSADRPEKKIIFTARETGGQIVLSIRDFGPGISADSAPRIFNLFVRAEDERVRKTTGTGIGLALVRSLAQQMNASVTFENKDPGCEFSASFKLSEV